MHGTVFTPAPRRPAVPRTRPPGRNNRRGHGRRTVGSTRTPGDRAVLSCTLVSGESREHDPKPGSLEPRHGLWICLVVGDELVDEVERADAREGDTADLGAIGDDDGVPRYFDERCVRPASASSCVVQPASTSIPSTPTKATSRL